MTREMQPQGSSNRAFGLVMAAAFMLIGLAPLIHGDLPHVHYWSIIVGLLFFCLALVYPKALAALNRLWGLLGLALHSVMTPVILAGLYWTTIVPIGFAMRALGKDPLRLRLDRTSASYWIHRSPPGPSGESMKDQF